MRFVSGLLVGLCFFMLAQHSWAEQSDKSGRPITKDAVWVPITKDDPWIDGQLIQLMKKQSIVGEDAQRLFKLLVKRQQELEPHYYEELTTRVEETEAKRRVHFKTLPTATETVTVKTITQSPKTLVWKKGRYFRIETLRRSGASDIRIIHPEGAAYDYDASTDTYIKKGTNAVFTELKEKDPIFADLRKKYLGDSRVGSLLESEPYMGVTALGTEVVGGEETVIFELAYPDTDVKPKVWVSTRTGFVPRMVMAKSSAEAYVATTVERFNFVSKDIPDNLFEIPKEKIKRRAWKFPLTIRSSRMTR